MTPFLYSQHATAGKSACFLWQNMKIKTSLPYYMLIWYFTVIQAAGGNEQFPLQTKHFILRVRFAWLGAQAFWMAAN